LVLTVGTAESRRDGDGAIILTPSDGDP